MEKPDAERAREFVSSGDYYWNSGMFLFRARRYLQELERFAPGDGAHLRGGVSRPRSADLDFTRIDAASFEQCPADSIDYAVMEKTADAVVVPLDGRAGATSARGRRCTRRAKRTPTATSRTAT